MEINVNIRLSAAPELTRTLETIANAVAAIKICTMAEEDPDVGKKLSAPVKETKAPEPTKAEKTEPAKDEPTGDKTAPDAPTNNNPDEIIDKSLIPSIRKTAGTFSASRPDGKEVIKKWLNDNGFKGLASLTYKGAEDFTVFLENEVKKNA